MKKIRSSKKGFTLAELLIVVAIIGVLVGISIPIFTAQLEKSREATDIANLRAAKAAAVAAYLEGAPEKPGDDTAITWKKDSNNVYDGSFETYYDASEGKLVKDAPSDGYGEGTGVTGSANNEQFGYKPGTSVQDQVIKIVVDKEGVCTFSWVAKAQA